ncbi:unnamed protein product [Tilletia controversa]|uniref:JmjC domain-containing protein n=2 Tax=Tilletia TaxID=13289 RepID=A0A177UL86_9BASI|nr:hypothetical protein CF336_g5504 [Tilletia laevis]KAE8257022.1 hypothetical protein A4X03_0g4822 [Tilletia caries]CAD6942036.1 unnamed protein product [Tilletia controversa]CAD6884398.1 unnamed protein product [Tilletia caries]CAD6904088.1 unnamed protein product [Tilletia caries]
MARPESSEPVSSVARLQQVPSYADFADQYLRPNRPCLLPQDLVKGWPIFRLLATAGDNADRDAQAQFDETSLHPAFDMLQERYGQHHRVPVVLSSVSSQERTDMMLSDAVELMRTHKLSRSGTVVYVKDWHIFRQERLWLRKERNDNSSEGGIVETEVKAAAELYDPPSLFKDDWMNNVRDSEADDFAFCYAGSKGSSTGLHRDVYTSYSWSTNIIGQKRWRLFPPTCVRKLRRFPNIRTSELASNCDEMDERSRRGELGTVAEGKAGWPLWEEARSEALELVQEPGETIFVPSNWYHEVLNLTDCISINHNWCNTYNLESMFDSMVEEVEDVEASLEDVRVTLEQGSSKEDEWRTEWVGIVQQVARQDAGWAWSGFWEMVLHNLTVPPTEAQYKPEDEVVKQVIRQLLERFQSRPEAPYLGDDVDTCIQQLQSIL